MKTIALIFCVAIAGSWAASVDNTYKTDFRQVREKCQSDSATHVDEDIWKKVQHEEKVELPSNWGAHILCTSIGTGLQNVDGSINVEELRSRFATGISDESVINKNLRDCGVAQSTPEITALHLFNCLHDFHKEYGYGPRKH